MIDSLKTAYATRRSNRRILCDEAIKFIDLYISKLDDVPESKQKPESLMLLKCLIKAGDDLPLLPYYKSPAEFHKAFRVGEIIYNRGMTSYDTIAWHLLHADDVIELVYREYFQDFYRQLDEENTHEI